MGSGDKLNLTSETKKDPATQYREADLWARAQAMSDKGAFQNQYGPASAMPGMSDMSMAGQKYLTNSILGPGGYGDAPISENLGFGNYTRPDTAPTPTSITADDIAARTAAARTAAATYSSEIEKIGDPDDSNEVGPIGGDGDPEIIDPLPGEPKSRVDIKGGVYGKTDPSPTPMPPIYPKPDPSPTPMPPIYTKPDPYIPPYQPPVEPPFVEGGPVAPGAGMPGLLGARGEEDLSRIQEGLDPFSPTVGVRDIEEGAEATRRILQQGGPGTPGYTNIGSPTIGTTSVGDITDITGGQSAAPSGSDFGEDVAPDEFVGASFLGGPDGPSISDYVNTAGTEAAVTQARQDYEVALNREKSRQAAVGAFGARGTVEEAGLIGAQERNIAQIRGAGYDRAAQMMESDLSRSQQAGIQSQQLGTQAGMQTQQLEAQGGRQTEQLGTQVEMQNAQNEIRVAEQNMQAALQTGNQQAAIDAQRQLAQSQMGLDAATRNQAAGLQASGMGLDAGAQFRQQQMGAAQQLADIGGMTQGATFGAASQLQQMGAQQEQTERLQQAWDYEQWLRGQEGGAQSLALMQGMMPGGSTQQFQRGPDRFGQILGAATSIGGAAIAGSDVRMKENIKYAGTENGFNVYDFNYIGGDNRYRGVMAQEVMERRPDAVESRNGVYWVDYGALGMKMEAI